MTGQYKRGQKFVKDYHRYTFRLQNSDGSFSTEWFRERAWEDDYDRLMQTSGHIFEWLAFSLDDEQLEHDKVVRAAEFLTDLLGDHKYRDWKIGPLGHALHGLVMYYERALSGRPMPTDTDRLARQRDRTALLPRDAKRKRDASQTAPGPQLIAP